MAYYGGDPYASDDGGGPYGGGGAYYAPSSTFSSVFSSPTPSPTSTPPIAFAPPPPTTVVSVSTATGMATPSVFANSALLNDGAGWSLRSMEAGLMVGAFGACLGFGVTIFLARSYFVARASSGAAMVRGRVGVLWAMLVVLLLLLLGVKTVGGCVYVFYLFIHPEATIIPKLLSVLLPAFSTAVSELSQLTLAYSAFWLLTQPSQPGQRRSSLAHRLTAAAVTSLAFLAVASAATGFLAAVKSTATTASGANTWRLASLASAAAALALDALFSVPVAGPRWRLWARRALVARRDTYVFDEKAGLRVPRTVEEGAAKPRGWGDWVLGTLLLQSGALALIFQGATLGLLACGKRGYEEWVSCPAEILPSVYLATALRWLTHFLVHPPAPAPAQRGIDSVNAFLAASPYVLDDDARSVGSLEKDRGAFNAVAAPGVGGRTTPDVPGIYALYANGDSANASATALGGKGADLESGAGGLAVPVPALSINTSVRPSPSRQGTADSAESGSSSRNQSRWSGSTCSPKTAAKFFRFKGGKNGRAGMTPTPPLPGGSSRTPTPDHGLRGPSPVEMIARPGDALVPPPASTRPVPAASISAPTGAASPQQWAPPSRGQLALRALEEEDEDEPPTTSLAVPPSTAARSSYGARTESDAWDLERFATSPRPGADSPSRELAPGVSREQFVPKAPPTSSRNALAAANRAEGKVKWADDVRIGGRTTPSPPLRAGHLSAMSAVSSASNYSRD